MPYHLPSALHTALCILAELTLYKVPQLPELDVEYHLSFVYCY